MSSDKERINLEKRKFLTISTSVVGGVAVASAAVPFLGSWMPSIKASSAGAPVDVDIGFMDYGQLLLVEWRGKPIWVVKRDKTTLSDLSKVDEDLADPNSTMNQQPAYATNLYRSRNKTYLVVEGICTHLGCSPTYVPLSTGKSYGSNWQGGFYCPCHGSLYDMAGRVYSGMPAPKNLYIPEYRFLNDRTIRIGESEATAV